MTKSQSRTWKYMVCIALVLASSACGSSSSPTSLPQPSATTQPTAPPEPTATPLPTATPRPTATPPPAERIVVEMVEPVKRTLNSEEYQLYNCESTTEMRKVRSVELPLQKAITVSERATPVKGGQEVMIPEDVRALLVDQAESTYAEVYKAASATLDQEEFVVPGQRTIAWDIEWEEQQYACMVSFQMKGANYTASCTYTLGAPNITLNRIIVCTG